MYFQIYLVLFPLLITYTSTMFNLSKLIYAVMVICITLCAGPSSAQNSEMASGKNQSDKDLQEVNSKFRYQGHPINPKIINAFLPWMSDSRPNISAIDLAAATGTNQYYLNPEDTGTSANLGFPGEMGKGSCSYEYLGKTENNIHVVRVMTNGGGSGYFNSILFFSFKIGKSFDAHGERQKQLLMILESFYMEGDRTTAKVSISKNKVRIDKPASMTKAVELEF